MRFKKSIATTVPLFLVLVALFLFGYNSLGAVSLWQAPVAAPPAVNVAQPIHAGQTDQVKAGGLSVSQLVVVGNAKVTNIHAEQFCDPTGASCAPLSELLKPKDEPPPEDEDEINPITNGELSLTRLFVTGDAEIAKIKAEQFCDPTGASCIPFAQLLEAKNEAPVAPPPPAPVRDCTACQTCGGRWPTFQAHVGHQLGRGEQCAGEYQTVFQTETVRQMASLCCSI